MYNVVQPTGALGSALHQSRLLLLAPLVDAVRGCPAGEVSQHRQPRLEGHQELQGGGGWAQMERRGERRSLAAAGDNLQPGPAAMQAAAAESAQLPVHPQRHTPPQADTTARRTVPPRLTSRSGLL